MKYYRVAAFFKYIPPSGMREVNADAWERQSVRSRCRGVLLQ